ncbi:MAG: replication initiation protein [Cetobacterium sp.]|uniref:replication initiation protein n=1 Tax=Cetobacterium sp. TaxID=2071632 RepID=UPI002FC5DAE1
MNKNYLVTKSNYFIMNSSYDLSLEEQKIILTLASMVQPDDEDFKPYKFRIADFMTLLGVEDKSKYTEIPKITKELMKKVFEIQDGNRLIQTAWLSGVIYEKGSGEVELTFSSYLKPYMLKLSSMFTQYKLTNILCMKSKYSPRIYEILKCNEFKKQTYIKMEIEELRKLLKAENIYSKYNDFKRYIIIRTQKELKKLTDISYDFEEIKTGRKVTSIKFFIKKNGNAILNKSKIIKNEESENKENIKKIQSIMVQHEVTELEALKIYKSANKDFKQISKVYNHFKNKKADNFIALIIKMVKPGEFIEPKKSKNVSQANIKGINQREYDFEKLEREYGYEKLEREYDFEKLEKELLGLE